MKEWFKKWFGWKKFKERMRDKIILMRINRRNGVFWENNGIRAVMNQVDTTILIEMIDQHNKEYWDKYQIQYSDFDEKGYPRASGVKLK
jgi:hypothetical protein